MKAVFVISVLAMLAVHCLFSVSEGAEEKKPQIRPTGLQLDVGLVDPETASDDLILGATLRLGSIFRHWLGFSAGFSYWSADADSEQLGQSRSGKITDTRVFSDVRVEFLKRKMIRPFIGVGLGLHFLGADVPGDPNLESALGSTNLGWEIPFGVSVGRAFRASAEARRQFASDADNWAFTVGLGIHWGDLPPKRGSKPAEYPGESGAGPPMDGNLQHSVTLSLRSSVVFVPDGDSFLPNGMSEVDRMAETVQKYHGAMVFIEGHTDEMATRDGNLILSQRRAEAVERRLILAGIPSANLRTVGYGQDRPISDNSNAEGRDRNRRIEIRIVPPGGG